MSDSNCFSLSDIGFPSHELEPACHDANFIVSDGVYEPVAIIDTPGLEPIQLLPEGLGLPAPEKWRPAGFLY